MRVHYFGIPSVFAPSTPAQIGRAPKSRTTKITHDFFRRVLQITLGQQGAASAELATLEWVLSGSSYENSGITARGNFC
jgi:hypothetical protein